MYVGVLHNLDAGLLARSQYSEGPATGHLDSGFSWFPCVYKRMLRWFPTFQVATTCFSCSRPELNFLDPYFIFMYVHNNHRQRVTAHLFSNILYYIYYVMLCYAMLCYVMLCYIILCYIILYYIVLYYIILYYIILCYVMIYDMIYHII